MVTRRMWSLVSVLALLGTFVPAWAAARGPLGVGSTASSPPAGPEIDPHILEELAAAPDGTAEWFVLFREQADLSPAYDIHDWDRRGWFVYDTLRATAERSQARVRTWLEARGIAYRSFFGANSLFIRADEATLYALAAFPEVAGFRANHAYTIPAVSTKPQPEGPSPDAVAWGISRVGADRVWADFGVKGQGIVVAHIDTGAEYTHDALYPNYKCGAGPHADCWLDPSGACPTAPCDVDDRGTHLMGILAGDDDPALTYNAGVAPDARWIACRGCSQDLCTQLSVTTCADWILAPNANPSNRPHVVNVSLEGIGCDPWFRSYVQAWRAAGLFSSFMAGGGGPACATISTLAGYPDSFSVGATDENDYILNSSGRGPSCYGEIKPEVTAPGRYICSSIPGNGWSCGYSGTSFANAHAAGLAALLWSADPGLAGDIAATEYMITSTVVCREDLYCGGYPCPGNNNVYGWGRIDAYAAVAAALQPCEPVGNVDFAWQPVTPTAGVEVSFTASASGTSPISYTWELGDGTPAEGQVVTHTYHLPGLYTVVLTATNCETATAVVSHTVAVLPCEPVVGTNFSWEPLTPSVGQEVTFTATAWGGSSGWLTETVDSIGGEASLAVDAQGRPHIAYAPGFPHSDLRYAYYDGSSWITETVADVGLMGGYPSLALDSAGRPHISYYDDLIPALRHAFYNGSAWVSETVESSGYYVGLETSIALDPDDPIHISYYDAPQGDLKHAYYDGSTWHIEVVDGVGRVGRWSSLALDAAGLPHIAYTADAPGFELKYAYHDGLTWQIQTLEVGACGHPSLALDAADRSHIAFEYGLSPNTTLVYRGFDQASPITLTIPGAGSPSLALDGSGRAHIGYAQGSPGRPKYTFYEGTHWVSDTVDPGGEGMDALALDRGHRPHVTYHGQTTDQVYARRAALPDPPVTYTWNLGDGDLSQGQVITHTYDQAGTYTVVLTATNCQRAGVATATHVVAVLGQPCEPVHDAVFAWVPYTPTVSQVVTFSGSAGGTLPITYSWKLDEETWKTGQVVTHSYGLSGTYLVAMTATNCSTATAVVIRTITVVAQQPCEPAHEATFAWTPFTPSVGLLVTFTASAAGTPPITFTWHWGDDITGSGAIATHVYGTTGTYTVTLQAQNRCGEDLAIRSLTVVPASWRIYLPLVVKQAVG